jgi:hypothetical protein
MREDRAARLSAVDAFLGGSSWDRTWAEMDRLLGAVTDSDEPPVQERPARAGTAVAAGGARGAAID